MTGFYERIAATRGGGRALSAARLRYQALKLLHSSLVGAGITQVELAKRLGVRKSAVNQVFKGDGNVRISTLAEYLHEMGVEVAMSAVPLGSQRENAVEDIDREWRTTRPVRRVSTQLIGVTHYSEDIQWRTSPINDPHRLGVSGTAGKHGKQSA